MKQILLINDVVGHSHVGMVAMMPILTYMGHTTYNLPTALVSNTLDYGKFNILETTDYMRGTMPVWDKLGFRFDAACTGLMFSEEQANIVSDYCARLRDKGTTIFVDPIMGDGGRLYNGMTLRQVELMRHMVGMADLCFPNFTEASLLTDFPFRKEGMSWSEACRMLDGLCDLGSKTAIITSANVEGKSCVVGKHSILPINGFRQQNDDSIYFKIDYEEIPVLFHGTGDIFSAILIGNLLNDKTLKESTQKAMNVVSRLIERNRHLPDKEGGIPIEQCLDLLQAPLNNH